MIHCKGMNWLIFIAFLSPGLTKYQITLTVAFNEPRANYFTMYIDNILPLVMKVSVPVFHCPCDLSGWLIQFSMSVVISLL